MILLALHNKQNKYIYIKNRIKDINIKPVFT